MKATSLGYVLLALFVVVGMTIPAAAVSFDGATATDENAAVAATTAQVNETQNNSSVNISVGQQLSTVISASSDEVQTDFENTAFEVSVEGADEEAQAEAIADRAEGLRDRSEDIREDYEDATEAYEEGEITKSKYAQRLATQNARATNLLNSYEQLQKRAQNVSALELRAAGMNQSALRASVENLSSVSGTGAAALLKQFTGEAEGEIELETADGLSIEIQNEDGEQSREIERPRDADSTITVNQSTALDTARAALSTPENGTWTLTEAKIKQDEGAYEFAFVLQGAATQTGEAEVSVDGSSGEVYKLEEEIERNDAEDEDEEDEEEREEEDEENDEDAEDGELAVLVSDGTPGPNATVTLTVLSNGAPAENVTVYLNEEAVGTTDANGTVTVTLPERGEAELTAQKGDAEGELEFGFEEDDEDDEVFQHLNVDASLADDTVSVSVAYNGSGVANATVYANDQVLGTTNADGTVTFTIDANSTEELELEIVKGAFEAELEYEIQDGALVLTEEEHEGDGDKAEDEEEEREEDEEDESEGDDDADEEDESEGDDDADEEDESEGDDDADEEDEEEDEDEDDDEEEDTDEEETETPEEDTDEDDES
ncbi:hypothetical protein C471_09765 [Halorubrum saccharovorum DSM 1137]|uniref:DUF7096 domain-containing protein n=1 Tax=Halorubrum saccharovorum DSM 1137 TaxID=1227484 RepID=M0DU59_9EURY|nr:hypothetical protein [Halorubrum saccharovorum]ELZ38237.1 hypothetical protein C471_09765 [Halorubrum saccharovorum DSM 1137]